MGEVYKCSLKNLFKQNIYIPQFEDSYPQAKHLETLWQDSSGSCLYYIEPH